MTAAPAAEHSGLGSGLTVKGLRLAPVGDAG